MKDRIIEIMSEVFELPVSDFPSDIKQENIENKQNTNSWQNIQSEICGCVSEKAPQSVTAVDLATAAIDPAARNTIVTNAVTKTINACVAEAVK